jgi:hypothetical protein
MSAELAAVVADYLSSPYTSGAYEAMSDAVDLNKPAPVLLAAAQIHATLAVAEAVRELAAGLAGARADLAAARAEVSEQLAEVRDGLAAGVAEARDALADGLAGVRDGVAAEVENLAVLVDCTPAQPARRAWWRRSR